MCREGKAAGPLVAGDAAAEWSGVGEAVVAEGAVATDMEGSFPDEADEYRGLVMAGDDRWVANWRGQAGWSRSYSQPGNPVVREPERFTRRRRPGVCPFGGRRGAASLSNRIVVASVLVPERSAFGGLSTLS